VSIKPTLTVLIYLANITVSYNYLKRLYILYAALYLQAQTKQPSTAVTYISNGTTNAKLELEYPGSK
jgi:hypothetical protein